MPEFKPPIRVILTATSTVEEAARIAHALVEERLAACATWLPAAQSIYHWQGQIESANESILMLKTHPDQIPALEVRLHQLHSYQTPEFLVLDVESASDRYLDWLLESLPPA
jgi:periplasmic divalent cation tolerance protein